ESCSVRSQSQHFPQFSCTPRKTRLHSVPEAELASNFQNAAQPSMLSRRFSFLPHIERETHHHVNTRASRCQSGEFSAQFRSENRPRQSLFVSQQFPLGILRLIHASKIRRRGRILCSPGRSERRAQTLHRNRSSLCRENGAASL